MNDFRKKQKLLKRIRNVSVIVMAVFFFVYIGIEPYLLKTYKSLNAFHLALFVLVIVVLAIVFYYESKFEKAGKFLDDIDLQISDAGYYVTSREEKDKESYFKAVFESLKNDGFKLNENVEIDSLEFDLSAYKNQEYVYVVKLDSTDRNDVIAYLDAARQDVTGVKLKRKGETVVVFITDKAEDDAVALSKTGVTVVTSRYNALSFYPAIVEVGTSKVYFLGNRVSRTQKLVINHVMNCDIPLKAEFIGKEKLAFQSELENDMKSFNAKDFKMGKYNER